MPAAIICTVLLLAGAPVFAAGPQPEDSVEALVQKLASPTEWMTSWDKLLSIGLPAVPELKKCLDSGDGILAVRSAALLYRMGNTSGLTTLAGKLDSESLRVRALAFTALSSIAKAKFGYDPAASAGERKAAIEKWRQWVTERIKQKADPDKAVVVAVDNKEGVVVLSIGRKNGVKKSGVYSLSRGDQFIAVVEVISLMPKVCVARVRGGEQQHPLQMGDIAVPMEE